MKTEVVRLPNQMMAKESLDLIGWLIADLNNRGVEGDIVEAGCNNGLTSIFISSLIYLKKRNLHCYDCFCPIPKDWVKLESESFPNGLVNPELSKFLELFNNHPGVCKPEIHQGPFDRTMPSELPEHIALALIDSDYYSSTRHAISQILPRMSRGGVIAVHDWEQYKWGPGVQKAVKEVWKGKINYEQGLAIIFIE